MPDRGVIMDMKLISGSKLPIKSRWMSMIATMEVP